ncbi:MAG: response regulator [Candidatus Dormibacteraeota bacterium]|nr:response regulator [Candidatus Dormibacteraeota bacterium]
MARRLYVVQDDLFFAERVRATARRLGLSLTALSPSEASERHWDPGSVVVVQVTLNPGRQLAMIEQLKLANPAPRVVAVSGHLETELRARARALGAVLAAHSSMERVLTRAMQLEDDPQHPEP